MIEILLLLIASIGAAVLFVLVQIREGVADLCVKRPDAAEDEPDDFTVWSERNLPGGGS